MQNKSNFQNALCMLHPINYDAFSFLFLHIQPQPQHKVCLMLLLWARTFSKAEWSNLVKAETE